jgi:hypothetical protein
LELKNGETSGTLTVAADTTAHSTAVQITGNVQLDDGTCQHSRLLPVNVIPFLTGGGLGGGSKDWRFGAECNQKSTNQGGFEYVTAYTKINYQPPENPPANADDPFCWVAGEVHFAKIAPPLLWGNAQDNLRFVLQVNLPPGTKTADDAILNWKIVPEDEVLSTLDHTLPFGSRQHNPNYPIAIPNPSAAEIWASLNVYIIQDELFSTWIVPRNYKLVFAFPLVAATSPAPTSGNLIMYNNSMVGATMIPLPISSVQDDVLRWGMVYRGWCEACNALRVLTDNDHCSVCGSGNVRLPIFPRIGIMPFSISTS